MPDSDNAQLTALRQIRNARSRLIVCFCTFPVYVIGVTSLVRAGNDITGFMLLYMLLYAGFGINAATRRCPRCHEQFFVKGYFLNVFTRRCAHCGLPSNSPADPPGDAR